jgi:hypothetical protein
VSKLEEILARGWWKALPASYVTGVPMSGWIAYHTANARATERRFDTMEEATAFVAERERLAQSPRPAA